MGGEYERWSNKEVEEPVVSKDIQKNGQLAER